MNRTTSKSATETTKLSCAESAAKSVAAYVEIKRRVFGMSLALHAPQWIGGCSAKQQSAYLLTLADFQRIKLLLPQSERIVNSLPLVEKQSTATLQPHAFVIEVREGLRDAIQQQIGVDPTTYLETMIQDLARQVELLQMLLDRASETIKGLYV